MARYFFVVLGTTRNQNRKSWVVWQEEGKYPNVIIEIRLFGLCYAMDGGYKGWNPYIERHLAIFVNYF